MKTLPILLKDGYKVGHKFQYPEGTTLVYSNFTPRKSRIEGSDHIVFFGLQYFIKEYLIHQFDENFFKMPKEEALRLYRRRIDNYLGKDCIPYDHIADLHDLGYLPLEIKAIREGSLVPMRIPIFTIKNTKPREHSRGLKAATDRSDHPRLCQTKAKTQKGRAKVDKKRQQIHHNIE